MSHTTGKDASLALVDASPSSPASQSLIIVDLHEAIGPDATALLCLRLGGLSLVIGQQRALFVEAIGEVATQALFDYWPQRERVYIPRAQANPLARRRLILKLDAQGLDRPRIALRVGVSERQVYRVLKKHKRRSPPDVAPTRQ